MFNSFYTTPVFFCDNVHVIYFSQLAILWQHLSPLCTRNCGSPESRLRGKHHTSLHLQVILIKKCAPLSGRKVYRRFNIGNRELEVMKKCTYLRI